MCPDLDQSVGSIDKNAALAIGRYSVVCRSATHLQIQLGSGETGAAWPKPRKRRRHLSAREKENKASFVALLAGPTISLIQSSFNDKFVF